MSPRSLTSPPRLAIFATRFPPLSSSESIVAGRTVSLFARLGIQCTVYLPANGGNAVSRDYAHRQCGVADARPWAVFAHRIAETWRLRTPIALSSAYVADALSAFIQDHARHPFDAIMTRSNDYYPHVVGVRARTLTDLPWIACVNDPFPPSLRPEAYSRAQTGIRNRRDMLWERLARTVYELADAIVFPCERLRKVTCARFPLSHRNGGGRFHVIEHIGGGRPSLEAVKSARDGNWHLMHIGLLDSARSPASLLRPWERFARRPRVGSPVLSFVGGVHPRHLPILQAAIDSVPGSVKLRPGVSPHESLECMQEADVLVLIEASMDEGIYLPLKFCDYATSRKPVLALSPRIGTVSDYLEAFGCGTVVDPTDAGGAYAALCRMHDRWKHGELRSSKGLADCFSAGTIAEKWRTLFHELGLDLGQRGHGERTCHSVF